MPLTTGGKLKIVASSNLGGLGAKDGVPVDYNWVLSSVTPVLLPWLVILILLTLKPNRKAAAWLIWLPLGCVMAITFSPPAMPSGTSFFLDVIAALAIGLAAVWLLSDYLRQSHRLLTGLCVMLALAGFSGLAMVSRQGVTLLAVETLPVAILLGVGVLASTVALVLGGWICRRRFHPLSLYLWMFVALVGFWLLLAAPFFLIATISSGASIPWREFFIPILAIASGNFGLLLPFLILSSASPFYRDRLKAMLHVLPKSPPVLAEAGPTP